MTENHIQRLVKAWQLYLNVRNDGPFAFPKPDDNSLWARKVRQAHRRIAGINRRARIAFEREAA